MEKRRMITAERKAYAEKRIAKLTDRLNRINALIAVRAHSGQEIDQRDRESLQKDRNSTSAALKRWLKILAEDDQDRRTADRIDGYDRDDLGESPDY